jgi:hypothetical protein
MLDADEATAIWGFLKSSSVKPTARSMERAGARSWPSTMTEECVRVLAGEVMGDTKWKKKEMG